MQIATFTAPSVWAPYLINGDSSGLDKQDIDHCHIWLDDLGLCRADCVDCVDAGFCRITTANVAIAADCQVYAFLVD
jgi:hypothetical protein